jgi:hypothetical protein
MKITPNLGTAWRAAYVVIGVVLVAVPFLLAAPLWAKIAVPLVGL